MKPKYLWIPFKFVQVDSFGVLAIDASTALSSDESGKCYLVPQMGKPRVLTTPQFFQQPFLFTLNW